VRIAGIAGALGAVLALVVAASASAATIRPTTFADQDGTDSTRCSLREAATAAGTDQAYGGCRAGSGADTIPLRAGTYRLTLSSPSDDDVTLDTPDPLAIVHSGSAPTTIRAIDLTDQAFSLTVGSGPVSIRGVTIRGGNPTQNGGGIRNAGGDLSLTNITLTDNQTTGTGGAITSFAGATTKLTNVTISGNSAESNGGGIHVTDGTLDLTNVTITNNTADPDSAAGGSGGGIRESTATVTTRNTVISGNRDLSGDGRAANCEGAFTTEGRTLVGAQAMFFSDCLWTFTPGSGDVFNADVSLGPLANNGGPTLTHVLPAGSSALDRGGACPATDQRGAPRSLKPPCDAGAYERVKCAGRVVTRVGTPGRDKLKGTKKSDGILGLAGRDLLRGLGGRDSLCGGKGRDRLIGGKGPDRLRGGPGRDRQRQ
jgi:predicted outer membrane repeat protein